MRAQLMEIYIMFWITGIIVEEGGYCNNTSDNLRPYEEFEFEIFYVTVYHVLGTKSQHYSKTLFVTISLNLI
jgi:hypothetical protein